MRMMGLMARTVYRYMTWLLEMSFFFSELELSDEGEYIHLSLKSGINS